MATIRKSAFALTPAEKNRYIAVIKLLLAAPGNPYGKLVAIHADMSHNMHGSMGAVGRQRFLPWHRRYLLDLEKQMQAIDPLCFIPYWKWSVNRAIPPWIANFKPRVTVPGSGIVQVTRTPAPPAGLPTAAQVISLVSNTGLVYTQFTSQLEGLHNTVHGWVGGTMNDIMISPADPIFWMHHCEIDRLWNSWQTRPPNAGKNPTLAGADRILDPWTTTEPQVRKISTLGYSYA